MCESLAYPKYDNVFYNNINFLKYMNIKKYLENNKNMNQIIVTSLKKNYKKYFKLQFIISIICIGFLIFYLFYNNKKIERVENLYKILDKNTEISKMYKMENLNIEQSLYLGKIYIDKINLEYPIFKNYTEELLMISPCRFYGVDIGEKGNICIAGHNYNDNRFFSRINELEIKDKIKLVDSQGKEFIYTIYDIFEIEETDFKSVFEKKKQFELTLLTCNNYNKKRIIIKAFCL